MGKNSITRINGINIFFITFSISESKINKRIETRRNYRRGTNHKQKDAEKTQKYDVMVFLPGGIHMFLPFFHTTKSPKKRKENSYKKHYHKAAVEIQVGRPQCEIKQTGEIMFDLFGTFATK